MLEACFQLVLWESREQYSICYFSESSVKKTEATLYSDLSLQIIGLLEVIGSGYLELCCWEYGEVPLKVSKVNYQNSAGRTQVGGFQVLAWKPFWNSCNVTYILSYKSREPSQCVKLSTNSESLSSIITEWKKASKLAAVM